jgi:ribonuclease M5
MDNQPVFIIEGWSDHDKLQNALGEGIFTIVTNGTKINNRIRETIETSIELGLTPYILSDPDIAGEHLAQMINKEYPYISRILVNPEKAKYYKGKGKYKYGIEYCSHNYLRELLGGYINVV